MIDNAIDWSVEAEHRFHLVLGLSNVALHFEGEQTRMMLT